MKALPPKPSQLTLPPSRLDLVRFVVEPSVRQDILRTLAEILIAAAKAPPGRETPDETR